MATTPHDFDIGNLMATIAVNPSTGNSGVHCRWTLKGEAWVESSDPLRPNLIPVSASGETDTFEGAKIGAAKAAVEAFDLTAKAMTAMAEAARAKAAEASTLAGVLGMFR